MRTVFAVSYSTESGDRGVVGYFKRKPTEAKLTAFFKDLMPDEFEDEEIYVYWKVYELNEIKERGV